MPGQSFLNKKQSSPSWPDPLQTSLFRHLTKHLLLLSWHISLTWPPVVMGEWGMPASSECLGTTPALLGKTAQWPQKWCPSVRRRRGMGCSEDLAGQQPCPNVILRSLKSFFQLGESGLCLCNCKQEKSDEHNQHSPSWIMCLIRHLRPPDLPGRRLFFLSLQPPSPLLALEFISPFKELRSPSGDTLCCQGVSSHGMLGNPRAEQEDKLKWWYKGMQFPSHVHSFQKTQVAASWGQQEQCGSFSSHFSFSAFLVPKEQESWCDAGLPRQVKAALLLPRAFWGTSEGLLYFCQAAKRLFNVCVKLVTPGGVIFKFLELKAQVLARFKRLSCVVWSWYTLL